MNDLIRETINMPNNLATMIAKSGMLKKDVAKAKGVVPETISRHCSGQLQFTLRDAEEYAKILDCTPQDVLFAQMPTPVFGYINEGIVTPLTAENPESYYCPWTKVINQIVIGKHTAADKQFLHGAFYLFNDESIKRKEVSTACFMKLSICKCTDGQILSRILYPEPGGKYTLAPMNIETEVNKPTREVMTGLDLEWAAPILSRVYQPDLFGVVKAY